MIMAEQRLLPFDRDNMKLRYDVVTAATVSITAVADGGGGEIDITSAGHGLLVNDLIDITGSTDYDGTGLLVVGIVSANVFSVVDTFNVTRTGDWAYAIGWANKALFTGYALPGKSVAESGWQITKNEYDVAGNLIAKNFPQRSNGEAHDFRFVWDDRKTYTYGA